MEEISDQNEENQSCPEHKVVQTGIDKAPVQKSKSTQTCPLREFCNILFFKQSVQQQIGLLQ